MPSDPAPVPHVTNAWRNYGIAGARMLYGLNARRGKQSSTRLPSRVECINSQHPAFSVHTRRQRAASKGACYLAVAVCRQCGHCVAVRDPLALQRSHNPLSDASQSEGDTAAEGVTRKARDVWSAPVEQFSHGMEEN